MAWTLYARQRMLACTVAGADLPAAFYLALFETSADPAGSPVELSVVNYARELVEHIESTPGELVNTFDVIFPALAAGSFLGMGMFDAAGGGNLWAWKDEAAPVTIPDGADVTLPAGQLTWTLTP